MIVVDSSVWIAHFRQIDGPAVRRLRSVGDASDITVGDLILLEVLQGARDETHARLIERNLREFRVVSMLDDSLAIKAARNYRFLRGKGVTVREAINMIIGTYCIEQDCALLHSDRDFDPMVEHLGLRIV
ncbi:type II toxin-antitoxin system VapC family toxin [Rhizobium binxianense]